jgi:hypothetical protein
MTTLPITHVTLYKHGVGFFERRGEVSGEQVELTFRVEEMSDVLKSLTAMDYREGGHVLSINYATPESREERSAGSSVNLGDTSSLQDLLVSLRGRPVRLHLDQAETVEGRLVGLDEMPERQPLDTTLVSILVDGGQRVETTSLARLRGVEILDDTAAGDLRFFLDTALTQEDYRRVVVHLTPGEHDLAVAYVAPAPTWRVSYRLVAEPDPSGRDEAEQTGRGEALLLGWGIVDNRLEEDLEGISLSLVAGMPISFRYDLYTPFTPERPLVEEEARVAPGPVGFEAQVLGVAADDMERAPMMRAAFAAPAAAGPPRAKISRETLAAAAPVSTSGEALGELFQYVIGTPVTIGRGQSAMVPIVSASMTYRKDLLYNAAKLPAHPVATLRFQNQSGLTLERGPVTVMEQGEYVGEAVLPFTAAGGEVVVPHAVELGIKVREEAGSSREIQGLHIRGTYLLIEEWDVRWREYRLANGTPRPLTVLVEHPRTAHYDLFDTPEPAERTAEQYRFQAEVLGRGETALRVQERRLLRRQEELLRQSLEGLERYHRQGLLDRKTHDKAAEVLRLWSQIVSNEQRLKELDAERQNIYAAQQQIQGNMGALSTAGKEGALRAQYVDQLAASEEQLRGIGQQEAALKAEIERLKQEVEAKLRAL